MEKYRIVCLGDSNTWGFDPRSPLGERFDSTVRWCDLLEKKSGAQVVNCGMNGRTVPMQPEQIPDFWRQLPAELVILLLGTNDILMDCVPEAAALSMEKLLRLLKQRYPETGILLIAPPPPRIPGCFEAGKKLAELYRSLAKEESVLFLDAGMWKLPYSFDGVHFAPEGHRLFAEKLWDFIKEN